MSRGQKFAAWVAGIVSTIITTVAIAWLSPPASPYSLQPDVSPTTAAPPVQSVDFFVTDELGPGQVSEQVALVVDGRSVGTLTVDAVHHSASVTVTVPRAGRYGYEVRATTYLEDADGEMRQLDSRGAGTLPVTAGRSFALYCDYENGVITLE